MKRKNCLPRSRLLLPLIIPTWKIIAVDDRSQDATGRILDDFGLIDLSTATTTTLRTLPAKVCAFLPDFGCAVPSCRPDGWASPRASEGVREFDGRLAAVYRRRLRFVPDALRRAVAVVQSRIWIT